MLRIYRWLRNLLEGMEGQDLVEYALIMLGVSIALVAGLLAFKGGLDDLYQRIVAAL